MHRIEPWAYLRDLFCLLPQWPVTRVLDLASADWLSTMQQTTVQEKLAANIFRSVTLADARAPSHSCAALLTTARIVPAHQRRSPNGYVPCS